jgi:Flp pilus assembly protein protease CpaA
MIPWAVCLAALVLATATDLAVRRVPRWCPAIPAAVWVAWHAGSTPAWGWAAGGAILAAGLAGIVTRVGFGDVALLLPMALVLGLWLVFHDLRERFHFLGEVHRSTRDRTLAETVEIPPDKEA